MQQFKQEKDSSSASMFAEGGKLHYLLCKHAKGGHIADCGCKEDGGEIEKHQQSNGKGKGKINTNFPNFNIVRDTSYVTPVGEKVQEIILAHPNGDAVRQRIYNDKDTISLGGSFLDNRFYQDGDITFNNSAIAKEIALRKNKVQKDQNGSSGIPTNASALENYLTTSTMPNSDNLFTGSQVASIIRQMHNNQPLVQAQQDGGNLSRRDALSAAMEAYGFNKAQARTAYANAKNVLRNSGLRGSALKQAAREMISRRRDPQKVEAIQPVNIQAPILTAPMKMTLAGQAPKLAPNYDNMSFNNAFRAARNISQNGGPSTFNWRGKSYGTNLASGPKLPVLSDDIQIEEPEIDLSIPEIPVEQLHVPMMGTTSAARSLRTVSTTPFIDSISGTGQIVSKVPVKTTQTTTPAQPRPTTGPVKEVRTSVGTGYYPVDTRGDIDTFVGRSEYEMRQLMNQDNNSRMPSIR